MTYKDWGNHFQTKKDVARYMSMFFERGDRVIEPTPGKGNLVSALRDRGLLVSSTPHQECWAKQVWSFQMYNGVCMNPPFTPMKEGYRILNHFIENTSHIDGFKIIALLPWLAIINSQKRVDMMNEYGLKSVTHLPRKAFPGTRVQTCIIELVNGYKGNAKLLFFESEKQ